MRRATSWVATGLVAASALVVGGCGLLLGDALDYGLAPAGADGDGGDGATMAVEPTVPEPVAPNPDGSCAADRKLCDGECVSLEDARYGCAATACTACALPNARATCAAGACAVGACDAKRADCNRAAGDGCETSVLTPTDCGGCGITCKAGEVCSEGACAATCSGGKTSCGGACVDTSTEPLHCGGCGKPCPTVANGTATCAASACGFTCNAGFGVCPDIAPNACSSLTTFYRDGDGDGYGGTQTVNACAAPPGFVGVGGDCHDGNRSVHPGQTAEFASPFATMGSTLLSFDYDCNGKEESVASTPAPACLGRPCNAFTYGTDCWAQAFVVGRAANPTPDLTCGGNRLRCIQTGDTYTWSNFSGRSRGCR